MTVPSISSETPMTIESDSSNGADKPKRSRQLRSSSHFMSLSVDADFFDGLRIADGGGGGGEDDGFGGNPAVVAVMAMMMDNAKKSLGPDKLAELSLIDPKRAKRILANRQSAARSKEQKVRYTSELERKVQTLQTEATTLSAQFTMMQRDTSGLTIENKELKLRLQALEQQARLRDALNDTLREEVNRLKIEMGQVPAAYGNSFSRALPPQIPTHPTSFHHFANQQAHHQQQQQQQLHMPQSTSNDSQIRSGQLQPSFTDFNQRV